MRIYIQMIKKHNVLNLHGSRRDAAHLHVTTKTQINLHNTQKYGLCSAIEKKRRVLHNIKAGFTLSYMYDVHV